MHVRLRLALGTNSRTVSDANSGTGNCMMAKRLFAKQVKNEQSLSLETDVNLEAGVGIEPA
nr:hypothetical protein [Oxalobacteraceae bacterium]